MNTIEMNKNIKKSIDIIRKMIQDEQNSHKNIHEYYTWLLALESQFVMVRDSIKKQTKGMKLLHKQFAKMDEEIKILIKENSL